LKAPIRPGLKAAKAAGESPFLKSGLILALFREKGLNPAFV
jgi:hypothetical protein